MNASRIAVSNYLLHLKFIRFVLPLPLSTQAPTFPTSIYCLQSTVNEKKSVYCTIWHLAAEVAGVFGYQVICCLIEIFSLDSLPCRHSIGMQVVKPSIDCPPTPSFLPLSLQIYCILLASLKKQDKKIKSHHPFYNPIYP